MNEQELNKLFSTLETEELVETLSELEKTDELKALIKNQLGQEFIRLLAIAETMEVDLEDAINDAITELSADLEDSECSDDDECCGSTSCHQ